MKTRLNLTIDDAILEQAKDYAAQQGVSLSSIVEDYFENLSKRKDSFKKLTDLLKEFKPSRDWNGVDLKKEYYEGKAKKYGY